VWFFYGKDPRQGPVTAKKRTAGGRMESGSGLTFAQAPARGARGSGCASGLGHNW